MVGKLSNPDIEVKGITNQIQKGIERGKIDTALNMIQKGYSLDDVEDVTGVSKQKLYSVLEEEK